jgi:hypothetical protein
VNSAQNERIASGTTSHTTKRESWACWYCFEKRFRAIWYPILPRPMKLVLVDRWKGSFEANCMARCSEGPILAEMSWSKWEIRKFLPAILPHKVWSRWRIPLLTITNRFEEKCSLERTVPIGDLDISIISFAPQRVPDPEFVHLTATAEGLNHSHMF